MSLPPMSMLRWTCQPVIAGSSEMGTGVAPGAAVGLEIGD